MGNGTMVVLNYKRSSPTDHKWHMHREYQRTAFPLVATSRRNSGQASEFECVAGKSLRRHSGFGVLRDINPIATETAGDYYSQTDPHPGIADAPRMASPSPPPMPTGTSFSMRARVNGV